MTAKKTLKIYLEDDSYVIERINEFNNSFMQKYSEEALFEALREYSCVIDQYNISYQQGLPNSQKIIALLLGDS